MSISGDIMSTLEGYHEYRIAVIKTCPHQQIFTDATSFDGNQYIYFTWCTSVMFSTSEGYYEYIGGIS